MNKDNAKSKNNETYAETHAKTYAEIIFSRQNYGWRPKLAGWVDFSFQPILGQFSFKWLIFHIRATIAN